MLKESCACLDRHTWSCLRDKDLKLDKLSQFVLDECDKCLDKLDMRRDVRQIFIETPNKEAGDDVQRNDDLGPEVFARSSYRTRARSELTKPEVTCLIRV